MTDCLAMLQSRRTIRRYKVEPLPEETLEKILLAAQCAQSWNNSQCWELVLIDDPEIRKKLQETVPSQNPAFRAIVESSTLICVCAKIRLAGFFGNDPGSILGDWFMHDVGIVTQNICTQAHALGLGTVVVAWLDHAAAKRIIQLPEGYELVSLIPVGYPEQEARATPRRNVHDFVHKDRFGAKYADH